MLKKHGGREVWSLAQIMTRAAQLACGLREAGLEARAYVLLFAPNGPEWIITCLALLRAGVVPVPVDTQMADEDLRHVVHDSEVRWIFTTTLLAHRLTTLALHHDRRLILLDGAETDIRYWQHLMSSHTRDFPVVTTSDTAVLFYTSGTTGRPKGVPLTHQNLVANHKTLLSLELARRGDRLLLPLPLHHVYAFTAGFLAPLTLGVTIVFPAALTGPEIVRALREERITALIAVPRFYEALLAAIETRVRQRGRVAHRLYSSALQLSVTLHRHFRWRVGHVLFAALHRQFAPSLHLVASAGAALEPTLAWQLVGLGWDLSSGYGLTETAPLLTYNAAAAGRLDSVGRPVPGVELRIAAPAPDQQYGEVLAKGPNVFAGYLHLPEKTAQTFSDDGYFRTGDVGYVDADGYLYLVGRASEMIVLAGGENIRPDLVEGVLARGEHIREVAVLEDDGRLVALIVPQHAPTPNHTSEEVERGIRQDIERLARELPSHHRISDYAVTVDALPRTRLGKLRRHTLRERYRQAKRQAGLELSTGPLPLAEMSFEDQQLLEDQTAQRLWDWLARRYPRVRLTPDSHMQLDLGVDSLAWLTLTLEIRTTVGVDLDEEAISRIEVVRDLLRETIAAQQESGRGPAPFEALQQPEHLLSPEQQQWLQPPGFFARVVSGCVVWFTGVCLRHLFGLTVTGLEHLPKDGPFVVTPNHISLLDPPVVATALPPAVLTRTYWGGWTGIMFANWAMRLFSRGARVVPINPRRGPLSNLAFGIAALRQGYNLVWFPEGAIARNGQLHPFRSGIGLILRVIPVPVVPVWIAGTYEAMPRGQRRLRLHPISITFGPPIDVATLIQRGAGAEPQDRIASALHDCVAELGGCTKRGEVETSQATCS
jgi:long-chain acyl-CoA synthetase